MGGERRVALVSAVQAARESMYDRQLSQPNAGLPFRGWYGGFTVTGSPSNVNVLRRYNGASFYDIAPFANHPFDEFGLVGDT
jgi:hypothetical protein